MDSAVRMAQGPNRRAPRRGYTLCFVFLFCFVLLLFLWYLFTLLFLWYLKASDTRDVCSTFDQLDYSCYPPSFVR